MKALIRCGLLPRFTSLWEELPGGDCIAVTAALFADLASVKNLKHSWDWIIGDCRNIGEHHFAVAADQDEVPAGWAVDASHGAKRACIVMRSDAYILMRSATNLLIEASIRSRQPLPA
jgi:hypothetical protein